MAGINFAWLAIKCKRRSWKRGMRLFSGIVGVYFVVIYTLALAGSHAYPLKSGMLTVIGLIVILMLLIAEVIADWREC